MSETDFEILSPAGNLAILKSAVNNGADAVYIGGSNFSARKNAPNFSDEEIAEAVEYAHLYGARVYVTVNTLVSDSELSGVYDFVRFLYGVGADALIIQDLGVLNLVRECFPDFEVHASTQMTIHNLEGARLAKELGFKRVVLSRELTFEEIRNISRNVDIELEVFVHGALCMSYSGQCLMSSFLGARSGNRGACAQPCRLPYTLCDSSGKALSSKDKYILSLKDLCLIDELETLRACGVTSLKIEGRMKSGEYVSLVTSVYNKYRNGGKVSSDDYSALKSIFSRSGFTKGYLEGKTGRHMLNYDRNNDDVYSDIRPEVLSRAEKLAKAEPERIPFDAVVRIASGRPAELSVSSRGRVVEVTGEVPAEKALNVSLDAERVKAQISKTGSTAFVLSSFRADIEDGISIPVKEINELRRTALAELSAELAGVTRGGRVLEYRELPQPEITIPRTLYTAEVRTVTQAEAALEAGFDRILVHYGTYRDNKEFLDGYAEKIALLLPPVMRDNRSFDLRDIPCGVYATNLSQLGLLKGREVTADFRLNTFNSRSVAQLLSMGVRGVCMSPELNLRQIREIKSPLPVELIVYGRIPVMTVQNCPVKSGTDKCFCRGDGYYLKDRKGVYFPLFTDKHTCVATLYNSTPLYMADRIKELPANTESLRFIFTLETGEEIKEIFGRYKRGDKSEGEFTRGHYYRGV